MAGKNNASGIGALVEELPTEELTHQARDLMEAAGEWVLATAGEKAEAMTDRLLDYIEHGPKERSGDGRGFSPLRTLLGAGATGLKGVVANTLTGGGGGGGGKGKKLKITNITEEINIGVPVRVTYNQWTQFQDFPKFTKRLETVEQESDEKVTWKAGIFLSHRTWESTIIEQVPDELIVWRSKGQKGHVDGTVTFHELAPNLTKVLLVLEYHPQGLFERTGNLWRAQGRRARLELKHFRRHLMTESILDPDAVEGWRGEIRDGEVVRSHEDAMQDEEDQEGTQRNGEEEDEDRAQRDGEEDEGATDDTGDWDDEEGDDEEPEDEDEFEPDDAYEDEEGEEDEFEDEEGEEDEEEPDEEPAPRTRSRRASTRG